jgi:hypothetical protein
MNGFLRQSTASQVRTIGPFVGDTDFKTLASALTIANTDIKLKKNGAASANKNSGGATADGTNGLYQITLDATDTNTVGELLLCVKVAGALVYYANYVVLTAAAYDANFASGATGYVTDQPVNVTKWAGNATATTNVALKTTLAKTTDITGFNDISTANVQTELTTYGALKPTVAARTLDVTATGEAGVDWANIGAPTTTVALSGTTIGTVTTLTNDPAGVTTLLARIPAALFSGITSLAQWLGSMAGKQTPNATAQTEMRATGAGSGTYDALTDSNEAVRDRGDSAWITGSGGDPWATALPAAYGAGTAGNILGNRLDVAVSTRATPTQVQTELTTYGAAKPGNAMTLTAAYDPAKSASTQASVDTLATYVDTEVAAIKAKTDQLAFTAGKVDANAAVTAGDLTAIADAILKRDWTGVSGEAAYSLLNAARMLRNAWATPAGVLTVKKEDGSTTAWTRTLSVDPAAQPIVGAT